MTTTIRFERALLMGTPLKVGVYDNVTISAVEKNPDGDGFFVTGEIKFSPPDIKKISAAADALMEFGRALKAAGFAE